jgi:hypothetical protein
MSDPDQEEIRRKRLARLGGVSATNSSPGASQQDTSSQQTSKIDESGKELTLNTTRDDTETGTGEYINQPSSNLNMISPTLSEDINMQAIEECKETATNANCGIPESAASSSPLQGPSVVSTVQRSDSSTAMDVTFTPSSSPPKPLTAGKSNPQLESGQVNNSSTSQKSQSPVLTDFDSGIETMDIDNEQGVQAGKVINATPEDSQATIPSLEIDIPQAQPSTTNKLKDIHPEANNHSSDPSPMERDEQSQDVMTSKNSAEESTQDNSDCHSKNSPEKRKRTSSSATYEITEDHVLGSLQNIFGCRIVSNPDEASQKPDEKSELLLLPECFKLIAEKKQEVLLKLNVNSLPKEENLDYSEIVSDILTEVLTGMTKKIFPSKVTKLGQTQLYNIKEVMFRYLAQCYQDVGVEERNNKRKMTLSQLAEAFSASRKGIVMYSCLVCSGTFETEIQDTSTTSSTPLFEPLLKQTLPSGFLVDMINYATLEFGGGGREIFEPLLRSLVSEARSSNIVENGNYRKAVAVLSELSDISIEKNRPVCQLMTEMTEWLPEEISTGSGKIT